MIYLDNNATTFIDRRVADLIKEHLDRPLGNPSSMHHYGQKARHLLVEARRQMALCLGVTSEELCYTASATEAMNLLLSPKKKPRHIVTSLLEHSATLAAVKRLELAGSAVTYLQPTVRKGAIELSQIREAVKDDTDLLVFMAANNETGIKSDIEEIAAFAESREISLIVDYVALFGKEPFVLCKGISGFCISGHKIHGPKGGALAVVRGNYRLTPLIVGGAQQFARRAGTEDILGMMALAKAISLAAKEAKEGKERMESLRDLFELKVQKIFPKSVIHGQGQKRVANVSNISFIGKDAESLVISLDLAGLCASHGAACSSGGLEPSHVLVHMGLPSDEVRSAIRFSLSRFTTEEEIDHAILLLKECLTD